MSETEVQPVPPGTSPGRSIAALMLWLVGSLVLTVALVFMLVLVLVATRVDLSQGVPAAQAQIVEIVNAATGDPSTLVGPGWMAVFGLAQFGAMVGLALALERWAERRGDGLWERLGFVPSPSRFWPMAAVGGLTIGFFPGWVAVKLSEAFPDLGLGALEAINSGLSDGSLPARLMMALVVAVIGPVAEELVFRGFVWERLRAFLPMPAVWVVSSLIFAAYHGDPVHVLAVSITGLYLGWFRWMTGSIWPAVLVHVLNNSLGATQALTGNVDAVLPAWIPGVTGVIALAAGAAAWRAASARASE